MMNTRFMYNFKKVGSEYVPETNRVNYDSSTLINNYTKYIDFAHWMAKYILFLPHTFKDPIGEEVICQELAKLGVVELKDNEWVYINEKVNDNE